ncbi:MAG TPA: hypothetical protein VHN99_11175, partial [Deinococcales bacterium]|nr:hypothetical protein [Deinococcales bacterium]
RVSGLIHADRPLAGVSVVSPACGTANLSLTGDPTGGGALLEGRADACGDSTVDAITLRAVAVDGSTAEHALPVRFDRAAPVVTSAVLTREAAGATLRVEAVEDTGLDSARLGDAGPVALRPTRDGPAWVFFTTLTVEASPRVTVLDLAGRPSNPVTASE